MTEVFHRFLKQVNSQGRDYGDGFSFSHFEGLTESELNQVLLILEERALDGDTIAINALRFIDKNHAIIVLEKVLEISSSLNIKAVNQACLEAYNLAGQSKYLSRMFNSLKYCSEHERWHCIQLLCSIEYGQNWFEEAKPAFDKLVLDEKDEILRHSAARKILLENGISEGTSVYKDKISKLVSDERETREMVLSEFG